MELIISENKQELGRKAAEKGASLIRKAIRENGTAYIIVATGASQFEVLTELVKQDVEWSKVTAFHLDEYIGIPETHPASFRKYMKERFADLVPLKSFIYVNGDADPQEECARLKKLIGEITIDVAFIGIGENSHIAFNDPPAVLRPVNLILWSAWIRPAGSNSWGKGGSRRWMTCLHRLSVCRSVKS